MSQNRVYTVSVKNGNLINGTHLGTLVQIANASTTVLELVRAWFGQATITTSTQQAIEIVRKSAAATVTAQTPFQNNVGDPASKAVGGTSLTGVLATVEGTDGDIDYPDAFSLLNGWLWTPTDREQITVPPSGIIALKLLTVPAGTTVISCGIVFKELG